MSSASTALTIGNFDGVHLGHAALVRRARELVGVGGRVVVLAFDPHPGAVLRPGSTPDRLSTFERRAEVLRSVGADQVVRLTPTRELLSQTPEEFVGSLVERYGPAFIVEGDDFRFGKGRAGDVAMLAAMGDARGFQVDVVPPVEVCLSDHLIVRASSSVVRWLLVHGRVRDASLVLGRPYALSGTVVQGDQKGRTLGYPTANLSTDLLLPADGVYAALGELPDGRTAAAAVNIGSRPTFEGVGRRAEAYLMNSEGGPLEGLPGYGWPLTLRFSAWVREDLRFDSAQSLVDQIGRDCARVQQVLEINASTRLAAC